MRRPITGMLLAVFLVAGCGGSAVPVALQPIDEPPETLSSWGVVLAGDRRLVVNDGVTVYSLNTPLFSDYALKLRTVWMPDGEPAIYRDDGPFEFPVGTIISKTFFYQKAGGNAAAGIVKDKHERSVAVDGGLALDEYLLVETRLLVRYQQGWKALPYVWNQQQDEAYLAITGDMLPLRFIAGSNSESFDYVVPDINQCSACHVTEHASKTLRPLGPVAWQLNRVTGTGDAAVDQLDSWLENGLLATLPPLRPKGVDWTNADSASLDERVRAYLDSNCAHCHNPRGAADTSALNLVAGNSDLRSFGVCKPPVAVGRGSGNRPYDIFPGEPGLSILLYRMQETAPEIAMPELGRSTVHVEAIELIGQWIEQMEGTC